MLRLLAIAPATALLTSCRDAARVTGTLDPAAVELQALKDRGAALIARIEQAGGATDATDEALERLVEDIGHWRRRNGTDGVEVRSGLTLEDLPDDVRLAVTRQPSGPDGNGGCKCIGYIVGCRFYVPHGEDTCNLGSCLFKCIDWFCRFVPVA